MERVRADARVSSVALVTRLIVSIGRFVPSRLQWDERSISHFRESVNPGRVTAATTSENEGELNHHEVNSFIRIYELTKFVLSIDFIRFVN